MLDGCVVALATVMQEDAITAIFGNRETHGVAPPLSRNPRTFPGVAKIAEFAQFIFRRRDLLATSGARPAISRSQG